MHPSDPEARAAHRTTDEPRALLAVEASARAYARAFPYLQWRYGETGDGFTRSDNSHLMALAEHDPDEFEYQVRWTADLLSERGMPRWMLEINLELMSRAAARMLPERPDIAEHLRRGSQLLAAMRHRVMTELGFRRCAAGFADAAGLAPSRLWSGMGGLLAAAVADEHDGLRHAVTRVHEWAADPRRFGQPWIDAVDRTIAHGRRL
jgi:hypothetical protein